MNAVVLKYVLHFTEWRNRTTLQGFVLLKALPEVYHYGFFNILYLKEINELLLWLGSVWTSFTPKVFCGTVCNEVWWIFSRACRVLLFSHCWFGFFFITLLKCTAEGEIMIKGKPCLTAPVCPASMRYTYYSLLRSESLCCANCVSAKHSTKTHLVYTRCDLKLIYCSLLEKYSSLCKEN